MKVFVLIFSILLSAEISYGQKDTSFLFNEYAVSINHTNLKDYNTLNKMGFGFGVYRSLLNKKKINLLFGVEFNRSSQFKRILFEKSFSYAFNVDYSISNFSIPVSARINFGSKTKIFIEAGSFLELNLGIRREGKLHLINKNDTTQFRIDDLDSRGGNTYFNYGPCIGLGFKIPFSKHELIIKAEYKAGQNILKDDNEDIANRYFRIMIGMHI